MVRILLVDDDVGVRGLIQFMLEDAGFEVALASDGAEGMRVYRDRPADLVLSDLYMPGKDGLEMIRELRREFPGARVIAMSGGGFKGNMDMLKVARHLGAAEVLYKPFGRAEVLEAIERVVGTSTRPEKPGEPGA